MVKSIFVMLFINAAAALAVVSGIQLAGGPDLAWLGALIATAPIALFFATMLLFRPTARTSAHLPLMQIVLAAGFGLAIYGSATGDSNTLLAPVAAGLGLVGWLLYDYWYSSLGREESASLEVGKLLPDFHLEDTSSKRVSTTRYRGAPTLFMFYRGNWCPFCVAQVRELATEYQQLATRGVKVVLVSPQPHDKTASLAKRFHIPCDFLVDPNNQAARALGIVHENGLPTGMQLFGYDSDTVLPTVIITGTDGTILFSDQTDNYRTRPEPKTFLRVLDEAGVAPPHARHDDGRGGTRRRSRASDDSNAGSASGAPRVQGA